MLICPMLYGVCHKLKCGLSWFLSTCTYIEMYFIVSKFESCVRVVYKLQWNTNLIRSTFFLLLKGPM